MGDVMQYLSALDVTMNMVFEDTSLPVAEQIKQHVFLIHEKLEQLVKLTKEVDGDEVIINKVHVFCSKVLFNFLSRFGDSYKRLCVVSGHCNTVMPGSLQQFSDSKLETKMNTSPELIDIVGAFEMLKTDTANSQIFFRTQNLIEKFSPELDAPVTSEMQCVLQLHQEVGQDVFTYTIINNFYIKSYTLENTYLSVICFWAIEHRHHKL